MGVEKSAAILKRGKLARMDSARAKGISSPEAIARKRGQGTVIQKLLDRFQKIIDRNQKDH